MGNPNSVCFVEIDFEIEKNNEFEDYETTFFVKFRNKKNILSPTVQTNIFQPKT